MGIKQLGFCLPLLVVSVAIFQCGMAADETGKALITRTCSRTAFPTVCTSTLESDPRSLKADLKGLSRIALELTLTLTKQATDAASDVLDHSTGYTTWAESAACFDSYNTTLHNLKQQGIPSFDQGKYDKAYQAVDDVHGKAVACSNYRIRALDAKNTLLTRFSDDVKTILHLLF
jgi:pectinesterase inhibitor-like protein